MEIREKIRRFIGLVIVICFTVMVVILYQQFTTYPPESRAMAVGGGMAIGVFILGLVIGVAITGIISYLIIRALLAQLETRNAAQPSPPVVVVTNGQVEQPRQHGGWGQPQWPALPPQDWQPSYTAPPRSFTMVGEEYEEDRHNGHR